MLIPLGFFKRRLFIMMFPLFKVGVEVPTPIVPVVEKLATLYQTVLDFSDATVLEGHVHEELKSIDQQMMEACVQAKAQQCIEERVEQVRCLECENSWASLLSLREPRFADTIRGRVNYERPVYRCTKGHCRTERAPFDEVLGLGPMVHLTPPLQKKAAWAGAIMGSFEKAHGALVCLPEWPVSTKEIQRITEAPGDRALTLQNK
jgi:hypothetical protein